MTHLAFDLGLTTTGYCSAIESDTFTCREKGDERFTWWRNTFTVLLAEHTGIDVWVEAPFIHPKHINGASNLLVLHGIFRGCCITNGSTVHQVTPAELKKYATGKGNADKGTMMDAAWAAGWDGDDHNEADAYLLWMYGRDGGERP